MLKSLKVIKTESRNSKINQTKKYINNSNKKNYIDSRSGWIKWI